MLDNVTFKDKFTPSRLISESLALTLFQVFRYALIPCASLLGIYGNVTSIVVLTQQGFKKCSNILLLALATSNILLAFGINNFPYFICFSNGHGLFMCSPTINYACYILAMTFFCPYTVGVYSAVMIPVLITGERLISIFLPFKAKFILTSRRTIVVISCIYFSTGLFYIYRDLLSVEFKRVVRKGVTVDALVLSDFYVNALRSGMDEIIESIANYLTGIIPVSLVTIGCVVIGLEVIHITNKRRQMTSSQINLIPRRSTLRTTKTLLGICVLYIVCNGFGFASIWVCQSKSLEHEKPLKDVIMCFGDLLVCVNCVGDFLIYFRANSRFRRSSVVKTRLRKSLDTTCS